MALVCADADQQGVEAGAAEERLLAFEYQHVVVRHRLSGKRRTLRSLSRKNRRRVPGGT